MSRPSTIAIDGTAASGKSTVGTALAQRLGYLFFDTGVMYRVVTCCALERDVDVQDEQAVSTLAEVVLIEIQGGEPDSPYPYCVLADGKDITLAIRTAAVDANVSLVASYSRVRTALTNQQRRIAASGDIVMVGRDIGTVVIPDAPLKIFMVASPEERARRRVKDKRAAGLAANYDEILTGIIARDEKDRNNPVSPMIPADDAIIVETDGRTIDEVLAIVEALVESKASLAPSH